MRRCEPWKGEDKATKLFANNEGKGKDKASSSSITLYSLYYGCVYERENFNNIVEHARQLLFAI